MAAPRVSSRLPVYDPYKSSLAYGDRAIPKLVREGLDKSLTRHDVHMLQNCELGSSDLKVRQQSLLLLCDVLHQHENLSTALNEGIATSLQGLLGDSDGVVRERSALALTIMAQHSLGRQKFLQLDMLTSLSKLFSDDEYEVRYSAHSAVEMASRIREGAQGTVNAGLVSLCVEKLVQEDNPALKEVIMDTLHWCFQVDTAQGLYAKTISIATDLLGHTHCSIRGRAARILFDLTVPLEGKGECCDSGCIPLLVGLLEDRDPLVRAQAAAALMSISVITKGKYSVLEAGALPKLVVLLTDISSEIRLNSIKTLTLLAETPAGKHQLQDSIPQLEDRVARDPSEMVVKAAQTALKVITWTP